MTDLQQKDLPTTPISLSPEDQALADQLADQLGEDLPRVRKLIAALVHYCGAEAVKACFEETLAIEAQGGMLTNNRSRRRTPGGVFLYLLRGRISPDINRLTFETYQPRPANKKRKPKEPAPQAQNQPPAFEPFDWSRRRDSIPALLAQPGEATSVKITLIGRPGATHIESHTVLTTMEHTFKKVSLPRGVPTPPATPTLYTVYIALKQWNKVEDAIQNPDDALIIEGVTAYDPELGGMAVFATNVTTRLLQAAQRQAKSDAQAATLDAGSTPPTPPERTVPQIPAHLPPEVQQRLYDLYVSAATYREKLAALEAKPEPQRAGYEMTRKLLYNTETQITALLNRYP